MPQLFGAYKSVYDVLPFVMQDEDQPRHRPVSVTAELHQLTSRGSADKPLSFFAEDGQSYDIMEGFDKGHLIANQFLNENRNFNIVPMYLVI